LKNVKAWRKYCKLGEKPVDIPVNPDREYKTEWISWGDWLGTNTVASQKKQYLPFEEARRHVRSLRLTSGKEFKVYMKKTRPLGIPYEPSRVYKEWKGMSDWLGIENSRYNNRNFLPFEEARECVRKLGLKTSKEWREYCQSGKLPNYIPTNPAKKYKNDWINIGDWLGTGNIPNKDRRFLPFEEARECVRKLGLLTVSEWESYCKSGKLPQNIPSTPRRTYANKGWKGFGDWLGTNTVAPQNKQYSSFNDARDFVHKLKLTSQSKWFKYARSGKLPSNIPIAPHLVYKNGWIDWGDWLGTKRKATQLIGWSVNKVKELIRDLIKNKVIDEWSEDERYHLLFAKGVLNLQSSNRSSRLLHDLIIGPKTEEQRKALEAFANSNSNDGDENVPAIGNDEIPTLSTDKLAELVEEEGNTDPLEEEKIQTPQQILSQSEYLESICHDIELMQFFVTRSISKLWKNVFSEQDQEERKGTTVKTVRSQGITGKKFHDTVVETFLLEYDGMESIQVPEGYAFPDGPPRIMQKYAAYRIKRDPYFCNLSGTGAGKTLSAILASRVIDSKMTLVVCPNDVVDQWATEKGISITAIFPDSKVITGKPAFYTKYAGNVHQYLVLNYDKFSQPFSEPFLLNLVKQKINLVVLDEVQFIKRRHGHEQESERRRNLGLLLTQARKKNGQLKVIGMSATPVINDLEEGKSLLQYVTGKMYEDLATRGTVQNAMSLYQKMSAISIREIPKYKSTVLPPEFVEIDVDKPSIHSGKLKRNRLLIEQYLTQARIPEITKMQIL
jgi:SNF2-related domain/Phage-integrase repeat unit